jgi:hypothetical protein
LKFVQILNLLNFKFFSTLEFVKRKNRKKDSKNRMETEPQEKPEKKLDENWKNQGLQTPCMLMGRGPNTSAGQTMRGVMNRKSHNSSAAHP